MAKEIKKVVLAYSGGLDTSIIIPWLKENYNNCEVIAVSGDVGQGTELDGLEEKAIKTGASKLYIEDLTEEFITDYVYPTVQAGAVYENQYLLGTSFARPIIAKRIAEIAIKEGADAICHGCTGKGNDQVRFELAIKAFAPDMQIIAPWRIWDIKSRDQEIDYAEAHNIPLKINRETNYSKDKNLWHLSHEGLDLEDPANEPQYEKPGFLELGVSPLQAPDKPTYVTIHFEKGIPTAVDGVEMGGKELVSKLNELGGENGIKSLIEKAKEQIIPLYFDGITAFAYDSGVLDGFLPSRDSARHITREVAELFEYSPIYYTEDSDKANFYLVHPDYAQKNASRLISWLKDKGAEGIAFRDIGFMLSADYDPNRVTNREQVKEMNIGTLAEARSAGERVMVKEGFDFTLPYADIVTDMDLSGNRYVLLDKYIPFYQIAIHGLIDYTGRALNLAGDYQTELLRSVEYGAGLNYTFTAENASVTQETNYTGLYGTTFASWEQEARETILRYQREAKGLNQQRITGHEALTDHVTVTTYADGTRVYVNYGTEEYRGETLVPARDYVIVGKEGK